MSEQPSVTAYKGFDKNLKCRDFQFKVGKEYVHKGKVEACESGFHACEYPLDVFGYYPPSGSRFAIVEQSGELSRHDNDSKIASSHLSVKAEISFGDLVKASVDFVLGKIDKSIKQDIRDSGNQSAATNTGNQSAATNTGNQSAATNTGNQSAALS